ncbi:MAG: hypothetical protein FWC19_00095 [Treponema sp.]|nr:hypothetical protein [Treponema sp.]
MDIKEYKCPNCGGAVKFDSSIQNMKCPYCDTVFEIKSLEEYQKQIAVPEKDHFEWNSKDDPNTWKTDELESLAQGSCPSCGAELLGDKNTAAMVCPNCGNSQIVIKQLSGMLKPEYIIPFKLEKKDAVQALKNFYKGKRLLPDFFNDENRLSSVQGVYLPYWLFDVKANAQMRFRALKTSGWADSNYIYSKTDHFSVVREGSMAFEKVPVDGSQRMDDSYMDSIEPFDYSGIKDFQTAYLSGYIAEKYDVDADTSKDRAQRRIKKTIETEFTRSISGYSSVVKESSVVNAEKGNVSYSMFPAWILNTKYKNENFLFLMNGQSGRLVGRLPSDPGKVWKYRLLFAGIFGAAFTIVIQALRIFM